MITGCDRHNLDHIPFQRFGSDSVQQHITGVPCLALGKALNSIQATAGMHVSALGSF